MPHLIRPAAVFLVALAATSCTDDRVMLERGPLGPATYVVEVRASGRATEFATRTEATLVVGARPGGGASFTLTTSDRGVIEARFRRTSDGSLELETLRGAVGSAGENDLASIGGQLDPPLPPGRVRIGDRWSRTRKIVTKSLFAKLSTELRLARFHRVAGEDTAELVGRVTGELKSEQDTGPLKGAIHGETRISWFVRSGRVARSDTTLTWTLADGAPVVLETHVRAIGAGQLRASGTG